MKSNKVIWVSALRVTYYFLFYVTAPSFFRIIFDFYGNFKVNKQSLHFFQLTSACNDISLANQCLAKYKEDQGRMRKHVQIGALMYFVRLECGHLKEATYSLLARFFVRQFALLTKHRKKCIVLSVEISVFPKSKLIIKNTI